MKNLIKFFMVMAVLCMTACSQTFEDVSNNAKPQEKGRLVMNVGSRSRTIMPTVDTLKSNIKSATLTANNTEIRSWSWSRDNGDNVINQIESDNNILLDVGTYSFEMVFCNENSDVILSGTIDNQEIKTGDNELTFDMQIPTTGKGNISITLSREADSRINKIKAGLYNIATGEAVENYKAEELDVSDTQVTYSKDDVPAGQYIIKFEVYDVSDKLLNTLTDVIEVIGGITTTDQITLNKINTQYTITYNLDGGKWQNGFTPIKVRNANKKITLPTANDITREGYEFAGWYDGNGKVIEISSGTTEDITVTAVWRTIKGTGTVEWNTTANTVAAVIKTLSGEGSHNIIVTGEISGTTISAINTALQNNSKAMVNLDLSGTTGLISIGDGAFYDCSSLTSVTIGDNVTSIGDGAFYDCSSLTSVTIGNGVKEIGDWAFFGCTGLTSVAIGDSVKEIGDAAFYDCKKLTTVNYKGTEEQWGGISIGSDNSNLTNAARNYNTITVTASDVSTKISGLGEGSYTIIVTGEISDTTISAIEDALTILQLENSNAKVNLDLSGTTELASIGEDAFYNCSSLTSVTIGDNVTEIGDWAFYNCSNLTSVTIGNKVTSIGDFAFYDCKKLTTVNYKGTEVQWGGISIGSDNSNLEDAARNYNTITVTASDVSTKISGLGEGSYTIIVTGAITNDTISDIEDALTTLQLENSNAKLNLDLSGTKGLIFIGNSAFFGCTGLTSVTIPAGVTTIGMNAFYGCSSLTNVEIPDSVTSIGDSAFYNCSNLTSVVIPDGVKEIGESAFQGCTGLTSVTIGKSVTTIGDSAFFDCTGLTSVTIGNSVTTIGESAFQGCTGLTSVTIGNNVTTIGESAFQGCTGLTSVTIPAGVIEIDMNAFASCSSLTTVNYKGTQEQWEQISIGSYNVYLTDATIKYGYTGE